ncbi:nucleoside deaminase [Humibacillus sp. DSM 29435]|uniref:nucleoside deaminase n=1 Tax=Humibacillus sp. DSM 29435 TaxID=1869167 RepID=UPI0009F5AA5B
MRDPVTLGSNPGLSDALEEAQAGIAEGGMPFGASLVVAGRVVARGRNRQVQRGDYFAHAETEALRAYLDENDTPPTKVTLVATESPCPMCAGAAFITGVRRFVIGEDTHYSGALDWLRREGADVLVANDPACISMVSEFRENNAHLWQRYSAG